MDSLYDNCKVNVSLAPISKTASANGTGVDTQGYQDAMIVVTAGVIDTTTGDETYNFSLEESDDNSSFSAVSAVTIAAITASGQTKLARVTNLNTTRKRYLRVVHTLAGTTPIALLASYILLANPISGPAN